MEKFKNYYKNSKVTENETLASITVFLALIAFVLAGGPTYFMSRIPGYLNNQICTFHSSSPTCPPSKYRSLDGSCNNKEHPLSGTAYSTFTRLLPATYSDGISALPKSVTGNDLPSPRLVSKKIFGEQSVPDPDYTIAMMQFGQFVAHDMSLGLFTTGPTCCTGLVGQFIPNVHDCAAIAIPKDDPSYPADIECIDFIRNVNTGDLTCSIQNPNNPISQISSVTSQLDLSVIYGNSDQQSMTLRSFSGGRLHTIIRNGHEWPQQSLNATYDCDVNSQSDLCYLGGDVRINQSPHLSILHILYIREHNRLANALERLNPHWDDEKLFQEARRINIAKYQYTAYHEWLTIFLGTQNMLDLTMIYHFSGDEYVNDYKSNVLPTVFNEHANAAFRFLHTQIQGNLNLLSESRELLLTIAMSDHFDNPKFTEEHFDDLVRGMVSQESQMTDSNFDTEIREFFSKHKSLFGQDLRAIDIQRARDHGVARYNDIREFCGLPKATMWEDYSDLIVPEDLLRLKSIYESFEDVELAVGAALETQIDNTTLAGPTFLCIYNIQFYVTRISDRYWFESRDPEVAFTKSQLAEIRKSSFAKIICDNSNNVTSVQPLAFRTVQNKINPILACSEIPDTDLSKWKD